MPKLIKMKEARSGKNVGDVVSVEDATADIYIEAGLAELHVEAKGDDGAKALEGIYADFLSGLVKTMSNFNDVEHPEVLKGIVGQRAAQAREPDSLAEFFQCVGFTLPSYTGDQRQKVAGDRLTNKYKSIQRTSFNKDWEAGQTKSFGAENRTKAQVMVETQGSVGGFTVPVQFYPEIIKIAQEESKLFSRVRKYPMTSLQMNIPAIDYSKGGSGASPYLGGMIAQWFAEGAGFTQTNLSLRQLELKASILGAYTQATRTLLADNAVGLQSILTEMMGMTISYYVTDSIINGTGVNQPQGVLNAPSSIAVARTGDSTAGTMLQDMANMLSKLLPGSYERSMWMLAPSTYAFLLTMNDKSGRVVYLPTFPSQSGGPASFRGNLYVFGLPCEVSQYPATHGTLGDIILIDPLGYAWGERQDLEIGVSEHVAFLNNELTWRFLFRGDGKSRLNTYLTLQNGDTVAPCAFRNT